MDMNPASYMRDPFAVAKALLEAKGIPSVSPHESIVQVVERHQMPAIENALGVVSYLDDTPDNDKRRVFSLLFGGFLYREIAEMQKKKGL